MFWEKYCKLCELNNEKPHSVLKKMDISSGAAAKWKKGAVPSGEILQKIANYFNVSVDYLITEDDIVIRPKSKSSVFNTLKALPQRWASLRKGDVVSDEDILAIKRYVNCSMQFLFNENLQYEPVAKPYDVSELANMQTLFLLLRIMDNCADNDTYRILQVQLSKIILYHLNTVGITKDTLLSYKGLDPKKVEYLYTGKKNLDVTLNYGLNFSDLTAIIEKYDIPDYQFLFTGVKELPTVALQDENRKLKEEIARMKKE